ncbi:MAG: YitT family protein [Prevotellaceae bacterium]|nr:YitT family protein [Prevotellaceae bacterium]
MVHQNVMREVKDYTFITLGLMLYTFGWCVFLLPYQIVTGGVTGLSAIIFYATRFPIQDSYLFINIALLVVALKILGLKFMMKTIYAIIMLFLMLKYAQVLMTDPATHQFYQILGPDQAFMSLIIGCSFTGTSLAIVFLNNGSTGGTDIIAACVNKYYNLSLGQVLIFVDICIIGSCMFIPEFGDTLPRIHKCVFGLCTMVIENFTLDYVMNARRQSVQFLIISKKWQEIANAIGTQMEHGVTILDGHGWFTGDEVKVLCILARKRESVTMQRLIKMIDPNAFVSQSAVVGVYGEGFDEMKVKITDAHRKSLNLTKKEE